AFEQKLDLVFRSAYLDRRLQTGRFSIGGAGQRQGFHPFPIHDLGKAIGALTEHRYASRRFRIISTSVDTPSGRAKTPSAVRACVAADSWKISFNVRDAPLMTSACSVKSAVHAT